MRPIKLVIKGLNSFNEEQTIDFNKLTNKGLFGIFGPTGSGKSTILDGLTLALYGKTSRDSSNFINTKCEEMSVSYEFQIRDNIIRHYIVDRSFKRNKDGGINARKPTRIIEVINGEQSILEEATTNVDKKCIEIIGLKFEDFIRTVVLPQGKFSEFLKLEGKPRREMLERLFSLSKYGDDLARKLGSAIKKEKSEMDRLTGQLKGYEEINEGVYKTKKEDLELKKSESRCKEIENTEVLSKYLASEKLWLLKQELENHRETQRQLEVQKESIDAYKFQTTRGESSLKVKPFIDVVDRTSEEIKRTQIDLLRDTNLLNKSVIDKRLISIALENARIKKDLDIPMLKVKESKVSEAIEEEKIKDKLKAELYELRQSYIIFAGKKDKEQEIILKLNVIILNLNLSINLNDEKLDNMQIDELHRSQVGEGLIVQEKLEQSVKRENKLQNDIKEILEQIENSNKNLANLKILMREKSATLFLKVNELNVSNSNCPGDANLLLDMQSNISNLRSIVEKGNNYKKELEQINIEILKLSQLISDNKPVILMCVAEIERLKLEIEDEKRKDLANILRHGLLEGEECPVCGSTEHPINSINLNNVIKSQIIDIDSQKINIEASEAKVKLLSFKEDELRIQSNKLLGYEFNLKLAMEKKITSEVEFNKLGGEWSTVNIEILNNEFILTKVKIEKWNLKNLILDQDIKVLNDELSTIKINQVRDESSISGNNTTFDKYSKELKVVMIELDNYCKECNSLKSNLGIEDFSKRAKEIKQIDKEKIDLERSVKSERITSKINSEESETHKKTLNELVDKLATLRTQGEEKSKQTKEKEDSIKNKVGERTDLAVYKKEIIKEIERVELDFSKIEKDSKLIETKYNEYDGNVRICKKLLASSNIRIENENFRLQESIMAEGFKDRDEAAIFSISIGKIKELKELITQYENNVYKLKCIIDEVVKKIAGKEITNDEWQEIKLLKISKEAELKELTDNVVRIKTELKEIKKKFLELKELIKGKEKLEHKLSLLNDLDGLFKGKRFVEFVALHQLKYVSLEASKRLKEITSGMYGLEVDEEGKFIIRDYKNGGATRDASTLSGGETFLASLSLALALSAQIQLKGTAPLELFFLDEGFGTLDDDLLEIVMRSLERIHNDKLSVGIISHIDSIKNRVPVKLIIEPAEAGVSGSKVRIEVS